MIENIKPPISYHDFEKIDMRIGTIINVLPFHKAKKPAYQLWIDFGELGIKKSSAQITQLYTIEKLMNVQVIAVVNFPPKQIANFISECLVLGVVGINGQVNLLTAHPAAINGLPIL